MVIIFKLFNLNYRLKKIGMLMSQQLRLSVYEKLKF